MTKLAAERLALAYAKRPGAVTSAVALRYFTVHGPRQRPDMAISRIMCAAMSGTAVPLYGPGTQRRDFTYVSDVVKATVAAADVAAQAEVVNVGAGVTATIAEILDRIAEFAGEPVWVLHRVAQAGDVEATAADLVKSTRAAPVQAAGPASGRAETPVGVARGSSRSPDVTGHRGDRLMLSICAGSANELFSRACRAVVTGGSPVAPRGMGTLELLGVCLELADPRRPLVDVPPVHAINPAFAAAEAVWILSGSDEPWIFDYNGQLSEYADGGTLMGAYGPRLRRWLGIVDQLDQVRLLLLIDPSSRQAVIQLFNPEADFRGNKDVPCTLGYRFFPRNGLLHMHTTMRSQDLWLGFCYDVFAATMLHELLAGWLGAGFGSYRHFTDSLHLYQRDIPAAQRVPPAVPPSPSSQPLTVPWDGFDVLLRTVMNGVSAGTRLGPRSPE